MSNLMRVAAAVGVLGAVGAGLAAAAAGCSSTDDSALPNDSGADSTHDAGDSSVSEGGDSSTAETGGGDSAGQDASDGGVDAPAEAAPSYAYFPTQVIQAVCTHLATCCEGSNTSSFDMPKCLTNFVAFGGFNGDGLYLTVPALQADGGAAVTFSQAKATSCLSDIGALACGNVTDTAWQQATTDCFAALTGKIAVNGTGCHGSIECAPGSYCSQGTCKPILALGAACTSNDQCEYRGTAPITTYCDYQYPDPDAGTRTCVTAKGVGAACGLTFYYPQECTTFVCNANTALCDTSQLFSDPGTPGGLCDSLTIKDAGGGG